jgi:hypothetical protein
MTSTVTQCANSCPPNGSRGLAQRSNKGVSFGSALTRRKDRPTAPFPNALPCANCHPLGLRELLEKWHVSDVRHAGGEHEWLPAQLIHLVDQPSQPILEASVTMLRARCDGAGVVAFLLKHETSLTGLTDILVASEVTFADGPPQLRWASSSGGGSLTGPERPPIAADQ